MSRKIFAVYLAYHKREVLPDEVVLDPSVPEYPASIARVRTYYSVAEQLECYANTMCPASMLIVANDVNDLDRQVKELQANFEDPAWLEINVKPYL